MKGLVEKTKLHACYKTSHIFLDLIGNLKFERVKCQAGKSSRSAHKPWPRRKALLSNMGKIHGWTAKKKSVRIAGTEFYVISYAGLVFGNNIVCST